MSTANRKRSDGDDGQQRLAVLIDADNAQASVIGGLLEEVARYGVASVKRIYGDFTSQQQGSWKKVLLRHSIHPVQQFAYTTGKNATDSAMIIDAMDLMYTGRFDGFCLVSSDSDFTRLAQRLREEGLTVYGFGERKTPDPFVKACDKFVYVEVLRADPGSDSKPAASKPPAKSSKKISDDDKKSAVKARQDADKSESSSGGGSERQPAPIALILQAIEEASDDEGWAALGPVGSYLNKIRPDFDPRLYGHRKLSDLLRSEAKHITMEERPMSGGSGKSIYVHAKK